MYERKYYWWEDELGDVLEARIVNKNETKLFQVDCEVHVVLGVWCLNDFIPVLIIIISCLEQLFKF